MRSRTSLFNATLFKKTIVRLWPVWFIYAFVWLLAFPAGIGGAPSFIRTASSPGHR